MGKATMPKCGTIGNPETKSNDINIRDGTTNGTEDNDRNGNTEAAERWGKCQTDKRVCDDSRHDLEKWCFYLVEIMAQV